MKIRLLSLISYFLMCLLVLNMGASVGYGIYFNLNQDSLAERFCVNKEKPKLSCNGKCHLKKVLSDIEKKDTKSKGFQILESLYLLITYSVLPDRICISNAVNHFTPYQSLISNINHFALLRPPIV